MDFERKKRREKSKHLHTVSPFPDCVMSEGSNKGKKKVEKKELEGREGKEEKTSR